MTSIRNFLITLLLATLILTIFLSVLQGYQASHQEIQQQMDTRLLQMAKLLSNQYDPNSFSEEAVSSGTHFAFQIFNRRKDLLHYSTGTNEQAIAPLKRGFNNVNFKGYRWRSYAYLNNSNNLWSIAAERLDVRFGLAEKILLKSLMPIILGLPIAALLIWFVIGHALAPLHSLSHALKNKRDSDLNPLNIKQPYREVEQVIQSSNSLLKRLRLSFEREKRFAADVAHELRTPLSVLKMDLFNLNQELGKESKKSLRLNQGVDRMEHLVQQILTLHRITPDQFMATFIFLDIKQLAQNLIAEHYDIFDKKSQLIELKGTSCILYGDPSALEILLINLMVNANKYTPKGGSIKINITEKLDSIYLTVEDSGIGIDESHYQRVFERFYRVDGDCHSSNEFGCGIGLSIVKHIIDLHKANITLKHSNFDTGLMVQIEFPKGGSHA